MYNGKETGNINLRCETSDTRVLKVQETIYLHRVTSVTTCKPLSVFLSSVSQNERDGLRRGVRHRHRGGTEVGIDPLGLGTYVVGRKNRDQVPAINEGQQRLGIQRSVRG